MRGTRFSLGEAVMRGFAAAQAVDFGLCITSVVEVGNKDWNSETR